MSEFRTGTFGTAIAESTVGDIRIEDKRYMAGAIETVVTVDGESVVIRPDVYTKPVVMPDGETRRQ